MEREKFLHPHRQKINKDEMIFGLLKLLLIVLLFIPSFVASEDFDPINYLNAIQTIRAEFIQRQGSSQINQQVSGEVFIRKPNQLLWNMESPNQKTVLINENTITYFDADLEQVVISDYLEENQVSWVNLFLDGSLIESSYTFNEKKLNNRETHIRFDDMRGDYESVTLIFKSGLIQGINLFDKNANSISIEFTEIEINQKLSDNLFNYQFPSSADVIDQRQ